MDKLNREFDETRINASKIKTIEIVMDRINSKPSFSSFFQVFKLKYVTTLFVFVIVVAIVIATSINNPVQPPQLTEIQKEKLVETSYMSANIISNSIVNATTLSLTKLALLSEEQTEFEKNIDDFNMYFNMLKVFIDEENIMENAEIETLVDSDYDYRIVYSVGFKEYEFFLAFDNQKITGIINIGQKQLTVDGIFHETSDSFKLDLEARQNDDYIKIKYNSSNDSAIEQKYEIEQEINGVYLEKEVKVKSNNNKTTVEIDEENAQYKLEKYLENGDTIYYLEYEIGDSSGEAYIIETTNDLNQTIYQYSISEDGLEKEIELEDPDEDEEEEKQEKEDEEKEDKDKDKDNEDDLEEEDQEEENQEEEEQEEEEQEEEDLKQFELFYTNFI